MNFLETNWEGKPVCFVAKNIVCIEPGYEEPVTYIWVQGVNGEFRVSEDYATILKKLKNCLESE